MATLNGIKWDTCMGMYHAHARVIGFINLLIDCIISLQSEGTPIKQVSNYSKRPCYPFSPQWLYSCYFMDVKLDRQRL